MAGLACEGLVDTNADWIGRAACRGQDPEIFHGNRGGSTNYDRAQTFCDRCEVRDECLAYALNNGFPQGIWGGLTPRKRREVQAGRARVVPASARQRIAWLNKCGWSDPEIAREFGITRRTVQRMLAAQRAAS